VSADESADPVLSDDEIARLFARMRSLQVVVTLDVVSIVVAIVLALVWGKWLLSTLLLLGAGLGWVRHEVLIGSRLARPGSPTAKRNNRQSRALLLILRSADD
jgi:hypothetical protein